ncbi:hypothetical protein G7Z17_g7980 [Cylindrodendrum hubeiense]|uniref:Uncharacterized protein n=1 Tax=Cylindrodendrum hubeiense TaxID=595255 RepID=A0A9P5H646_9HYPO|nr:hypothetical protein G7Z17_g7980 [Cylindrodendrum hubeiense]
MLCGLCGTLIAPVGSSSRSPTTVRAVALTIGLHAVDGNARIIRLLPKTGIIPALTRRLPWLPMAPKALIASSDPSISSPSLALHPLHPVRHHPLRLDVVGIFFIAAAFYGYACILPYILLPVRGGALATARPVVALCRNCTAPLTPRIDVVDVEMYICRFVYGLLDWPGPGPWHGMGAGSMEHAEAALR